MITNFILNKIMGEARSDWAVAAIYNIVVIERRILGAFAILGAALYSFEVHG